MFTAVGATALVLLTACGGGDGGGGDADKNGRDEVASINGPAAGGGSPRSKSADPDAGRPQLRLDSTREEEMRLYDARAMVQCMNKHGIKSVRRVVLGAPAPAVVTASAMTVTAWQDSDGKQDTAADSGARVATAVGAPATVGHAAHQGCQPVVPLTSVTAGFGGLGRDQDARRRPPVPPRRPPDPHRSPRDDLGPV